MEDFIESARASLLNIESTVSALLLGNFEDYTMSRHHRSQARLHEDDDPYSDVRSRRTVSRSPRSRNHQSAQRLHNVRALAPSPEPEIKVSLEADVDTMSRRSPRMSRNRSRSQHRSKFDRTPSPVHYRARAGVDE